MTPAELAIATMLAVAAQLGPFRDIHCTPTHITTMTNELTIRPNESVAGIITLVNRTCKKRIQ